MRYVGPIAKLPIVAGLLINVIIYAFTRTMNPAEATGNFIGTYLLCRWLIVPFFAERVYTYMCTTCYKKFETKVRNVQTCDSCFTSQIESIINTDTSIEAKRLEGKKRIFSRETDNEVKIQTASTAGEIMYCRHCGQKITPGNFCSSCGQKL